MPYIKQARAFELYSLNTGSGGSIDLIRELASRIETGGELNYVLTRFMLHRIDKIGENYENIKSVAADASEASNEFRRRLLSRYENTKIFDMLNADPYNEYVVRRKKEIS